MLALPAGAFTASVLFDGLSMIAENRAQAYSYRRSAAELLGLGLSSCLASVALVVADELRAPSRTATSSGTRRLALNGAVIAIYLLDLAARQECLRNGRSGPEGTPALPIGLSLLGLALLGLSARLDESSPTSAPV